MKLGFDVFEALFQRRCNIKIPAYDKSAFSGQGDRLPVHDWETVNLEGEPSVDVIIFEGWCVGFRALPMDKMKAKWALARHEYEKHDDTYKGQLGKHELESLTFINSKLKDYDSLTNFLQAFIHMWVLNSFRWIDTTFECWRNFRDADDTLSVYKWRLQQEAALRASKGNGMTDEQVVDFVNGCKK